MKCLLLHNPGLEKATPMFLPVPLTPEVSYHRGKCITAFGLRMFCKKVIQFLYTVGVIAGSIFGVLFLSLLICAVIYVVLKRSVVTIMAALIHH